MTIPQRRSDDPVAVFHRLHESGCFVMPNPWDVGSARALEQLGFPALATTSAGFAWTLGRTDTRTTLDQVLEHLSAVAGAVSVPVNADFQDGHAHDPEGVAANVRRAAETGIAGLSIEDFSGDEADPLVEFELAVERVAAARQAIDESGTGVVLTGRSEGFVVGRPDIDETIRTAAGVRRRRRRLSLRAADQRPGAGEGDRRGRRAEAGQPPDQRAVHHRRGGGPARRTPDQRRRHARPHGLGWVPGSGAGDRRHGTFTRFEDLPDVEGLLA